MAQTVPPVAGSLGHAASPRDSAAVLPGESTGWWLSETPAMPALADNLPGRADVVVIGAGYTGLNAALPLARAGRTVVVVEAGDAGGGCSTRNGGHISHSIKPSLADLAARHGAERAAAIRAEGRNALNWIEGFIAGEGIDCSFRRMGRLHAAHTPAAYEALVRSAEQQRREEGVEVHALPRAEQRGEIGSDRYFGGIVYPRFAGLHPARYHRGLLRAALAAGVTVVPHCPALAIRRDGEGFEIDTPEGRIAAREVAVATNGYTEAVTPWLRRRVIPIGSYVIATEALPEALMAELFPQGRLVVDTRRVVYYYGPSPDGRRVIFGGRVSAGEASPEVGGPRLRAELVRLFPQLAATRIADSWRGFVAYTFDQMAHTGTHDGMHYAMGYCGSGVSMASYLGMRMGQRILGRPEGRTAFDGLPFPTRPLYSGRPWFLSTAVAWYRLRDRAEVALAHRRHPSTEPVP